MGGEWFGSPPRRARARTGCTVPIQVLEIARRSYMIMRVRVCVALFWQNIKNPRACVVAGRDVPSQRRAAPTVAVGPRKHERADRVGAAPLPTCNGTQPLTAARMIVTRDSRRREPCAARFWCRFSCRSRACAGHLATRCVFRGRRARCA